MDLNAIRHETPAEIITIRVISGLAKVRKALVLSSAQVTAADRITFLGSTSRSVVVGVIHITRPNPLTGGAAEISWFKLIVTASY